MPITAAPSTLRKRHHCSSNGPARQMVQRAQPDSYAGAWPHVLASLIASSASVQMDTFMPDTFIC
jgi:hypothetical protein